MRNLQRRLWSQKTYMRSSVSTDRLLSLALLHAYWLKEKSHQRYLYKTRTLLVPLSLACFDIEFIVSWWWYVTFSFGIQSECYVSYCMAQNVKFTRRDRQHISASHRCEAFENLLHIDIAPVRRTLSRILHSKNWVPGFLKTGLAKKSTHSTPWQLKTIKNHSKAD